MNAPIDVLPIPPEGAISQSEVRPGKFGTCSSRHIPSCRSDVGANDASPKGRWSMQQVLRARGCKVVTGEIIKMDRSSESTAPIPGIFHLGDVDEGSQPVCACLRNKAEARPMLSNDTAVIGTLRRKATIVAVPGFRASRADHLRPNRHLRTDF